jgi:hypothetical protein
MKAVIAIQTLIDLEHNRCRFSATQTQSEVHQHINLLILIESAKEV